jgi:thimet oligopeptidase
VVRKKALQDFAEYKEAKCKATGNSDAAVYAWDQFFCHNWLLKNKYAVDAQKVKEYFPMDQVMKGFFGVTRELYALEFRDITAKAASKGRPLWHSEVALYEVWDTSRNEMLGELYIDPYPRDNKYNHFAAFQIYPRKVWADGSVQEPVVALVCNFPPPSDDKPALMMHEDVETFFHEFGHALHGLLTETSYGSFSGTAVARDFVECPSQMFENWVWDADVLNTFARHYETNEPLPDDLLRSMLDARRLSSGLKTERQINYGLVDMRYHTSTTGEVDTTKVGMDTMAETELFPPAPATFFQAGFGHMTGYQAGYYGYMWARVFAQDMFAYFQKHGLMSREAGEYYRSKILSRGGSVDEMDMLVDFLGREPKMDAFLEHLGLN